MKKVIIFLILLILPFSVRAYDTAMVDINDLSIRELQEYVDKGYLTYEKITQLYLDRIEAYNKQYNAIITVNDKALEQAREKDKEYKEKGRSSLIFGLPLLVKDNIDVKGLPTTNGTKGLKDNYPNENADVIQKLLDNGAIVLGKTNMDEFAFNYQVSHSSYGYTYNAFNTAYSSYGSSGGSAVGVSANLCVYALGSDTGVSVRVPSSANGVIGIRPSIDIMSGKGVIKFESTRDVVGVIAKYVEDSAIVLDIIDNVDVSYIDSFTEDLKGVRIGVIKSYFNPNSTSSSIASGKTDKFVSDMMWASIEKLKSLGAEIVYVSNPSLTYKFDANSMCYEFNEWVKNTTGPIKSFNDLIKSKQYTQYISSYNGSYCYKDYKTTSAYKSYISVRNSNISKANNYFSNNKLDVIIYPTLKNAILKNDTAKSLPRVNTPSSNIAPLVGYPALTIPMGKNGEFSYGLEIVAQSKKESTIYRIAHGFESINKVYKTPSIAPSLYTIPENLNKLIEYYEIYKNDSKYVMVNPQMEEFINNYDGSEEKINELIELYKNPPEPPKEEFKISKDKIILIALFSGLSILFIITLCVFRKRNKKRKRK